MIRSWRESSTNSFSNPKRIIKQPRRHGILIKSLREPVREPLNAQGKHQIFKGRHHILKRTCGEGLNPWGNSSNPSREPLKPSRGTSNSYQILKGTLGSLTSLRESGTDMMLILRVWWFPSEFKACKGYLEDLTRSLCPHPDDFMIPLRT